MPSILGTTSKRLQPHPNGNTRSTIRRRRNLGGPISQSIRNERDSRHEYEMNDPSFKKMFIYMCVIVAGFLWNFYMKNK